MLNTRQRHLGLFSIQRRAIRNFEQKTYKVRMEIQ